MPGPTVNILVVVDLGMPLFLRVMPSEPRIVVHDGEGDGGGGRGRGRGEVLKVTKEEEGLSESESSEVRWMNDDFFFL